MGGNEETLSPEEVESCLKMLNEIEKICLSMVSPMLSCQSTSETAPSKIQKTTLEREEEISPSKRQKQCPKCRKVLTTHSSYRRHYQAKHGVTGMKLIMKAHIYRDEEGKFYIMPI